MAQNGKSGWAFFLTSQLCKVHELICAVCLGLKMSVCTLGFIIH